MVSVMQAGLWAASAARAGRGADNHRSRDCWHGEEKAELCAAELRAAPGTHSLLDGGSHAFDVAQVLLAAAPLPCLGCRSIKAEPRGSAPRYLSSGAARGCAEIPSSVSADDLKETNRAPRCAVPGAALREQNCHYEQ